MAARVLAFTALALLAGTAGYVAQQWRSGGDAVVSAQTLEPVAATPAESAGDEVDPADPFAWQFPDAAGRPHTLAEWRGRLLVVNFWATWCPPCLREMPVFVDLQQKHGERGLQFVGVALDQPEPVAEFAAAHGINYPLLVGDDKVTRFMYLLGNTIGALPYTVVLDRNGELVLAHQGEWSAEEAGEALEALMN